MARYLLTADEDSMASWKAAAEKRGIPFAQYVRDALNHETSGRHQGASLVAASSMLGIPPARAPVPPYPERVWKGPDFKKPPAEKKPKGGR